MTNPILARIEQVRADGLHPMHVRVSADGRGKWKLTIVVDDGAPAEETGPSVLKTHTITPPNQSELPPGVKGWFWVRFPDDVSELRGSAEAVETWMAEVARVGKAVDWARFDGDGEGYPAYLTKPSAWLRETNPFHPDNPRNPANRFKGFAEALTALRAAAGLSVPDLARASGLSDDVLRQYETGKRSPTWSSVQAIATALGVPTDAFRGSK
jgi:DNA-binding XRE family transcriptional regulator